MLNKGCGTCRDRKVLCDRTIPVCQRCSRSNRKCQGYGVRLSWPKEHDRRRTILGTPVTQGKKARKFSAAWMVNVSMWDFELQDYLAAAWLHTNENLSPPVLPTSMSWQPFKLNGVEKDLLQYFYSVAAYSLTPLGYSPREIGRILLRLALSDSTAPAMAVMQSLLSVSSLHRFGPQPHAARLKISALQTLAASMTGDISKKDGAQYIAAVMLLCSYEAQQSLDTSGEGLSHIRGAKNIITTVMLFDASERDTDIIPLLDWVFYHDSLSRFSIRHWRRPEAANNPSITELGFHAMWCTLDILPDAPQAVASSRSILCSLSYACDSIVGPSDPRYYTEEYRGLIKFLYWEIMRIPVPEPEIQDPIEEAGVCVALGVELCQLAALVYLERVAGIFFEEKSKTTQRIERAFTIFSCLEFCKWPFPLLIFACEAWSDDQRITVLDLIDRIQKNNPLRSLDFVKSMIQSIWIQDDLADQEIGYMDRLSVVLSSRESFPAFV